VRPAFHRTYTTCAILSSQIRLISDTQPTRLQAYTHRRSPTRTRSCRSSLAPIGARLSAKTHRNRVASLPPFKHPHPNLPFPMSLFPLSLWDHRRQEQGWRGVWNVLSHVLPPAGGGDRWGVSLGVPPHPHFPPREGKGYHPSRNAAERFTWRLCPPGAGRVRVRRDAGRALVGRSRSTVRGLKALVVPMPRGRPASHLFPPRGHKARRTRVSPLGAR
jgi:hypothetical protein